MKPEFVIASLFALYPASLNAADSQGINAIETSDGVVEVYQGRLYQDALKRMGLELDASPEGKLIERVEFTSYDVLTENDPWPGFLRAFHAQTRLEIIHQELLFEKGQRWQKDLVEETARNLRNNLFLAAAEILPGRGSTPDQVVALVVTKDVWSLRANTTFSYVGSALELFELELTESNLAGRNQKVSLTYRQDLATQAPGLGFIEPRILGSRVAFSGSGNVIYNKDTGISEGGRQSLTVSQPLYSLRTHWGWHTSVDHRKDIYRLFSNGRIASVRNPQTGETIPYSYQWETTLVRAFGVSSYGLSTKHDISYGWRGSIENYAIPATTATSFLPKTVSDFQNGYVPRTEQAGMLFAGYHRYEARYLKLQDINSYALTEDFQLGLDTTFEGRLANPVFGFSSSYIELLAQTGQTWDLGEDLLSVSGKLFARNQSGAVANTDWVNRLMAFRVANVSPLMGSFRVHSQAQLIRRSQSLNRPVETLGGDGLLRGYPSGFFTAPNLWNTNLELRSRPWEIHTVYLGGVGFLDLGDAFVDPTAVQVHASTGFGVRVLFPQFNRSVLRVDAGFPLEALPGVSPVSLVAKFGQAFE